MTDTFRKTYTKLSDEQVGQMNVLKEEAEELETLFNSISPVGERSEAARCMAIARTHLETAIMYAVKSATTAKEIV